MRFALRFALFVFALTNFANVAFCAGADDNDPRVDPMGGCSVIDESAINVLVAVSNGPGVDGVQFTSYLEEETGIHIDWEQVLHSEFYNRLAVLVASESLPDLLVAQYLLSKARVLEYANQSIFIPLNDLVERCAPDIKRALDSEEGQQFRERLTMPDGEMYSFPYIDYCYHCQYSRKMWIYQPWLDRIGLPVPDTTDEFRIMLREFKDRDANDNGTDDEIPLLGVAEDWYKTNPLVFVMNAFIYTRLRGDSALLVLDNKEVRFVADTDQWREGLAYMNRLYADSLLRFKTFEEAREDVKNGLVGVFPGTSYTVFGSEEPEYQPIAPLKGPAGLRQATSLPPSMWFTSHITSAAGDKADTIAHLINWWFIDPIKNNYLCEDYWIEGIDWRRLDETERMKWIAEDGLPAETMFIPGGEPASGSITFDNGWFRSCFARWETRAHAAVIADGAEVPTDERGRLMIATRDLMEPYRVDYSLPPDVLVTDYDEFTEIGVAVRHYVMEISLEFIRGDRDVDDDGEWQEYIAGLKEKGVDKYVRIWQDTLDKDVASLTNSQPPT